MHKVHASLYQGPSSRALSLSFLEKIRANVQYNIKDATFAKVAFKWQDLLG